MSRPYPGPLSGYNSLTDKHLTGYFNNTRIRKQLQRAGLITRSGRILTEKEYRINAMRRDHQKYIRECLAQAIFHKVLDLERRHQIDIKRKLETFARKERVQRLKVDHPKRPEGETFPAFSPHPPTGPKSGTNRRLGNHERSDSSESSSSLRPNTAPGNMQRPVRLQPLPVNSSSGNAPKMSTAPRQKHSADEDDQRCARTTDKEILRILHSTEHTTGISPYRLPIINNFVTPVPPPPQKHPKLTMSSTSRGRRYRPTTTANGPDAPAKDTGKFHKTSLHSNVKITMVYRGKNVHLSHEVDDYKDEIKVFQQHCGGENLCVFNGKLLEEDSFSLVSRRHHGFPFSLTFYINGIQVDRLSSCCEYKHRKGARLGGKNGYFGFINIEGASPCYRCIISMGLDKKPSPPPKSKTKEKDKKDSDEDGDEDHNDKKKQEEDSNEKEKRSPVCDEEGEEDDQKPEEKSIMDYEEEGEENKDYKTDEYEADDEDKDDYDEDFEVEENKSVEKYNEDGRLDDEEKEMSKSPWDGEKDDINQEWRSSVPSNAAVQEASDRAVDERDSDYEDKQGKHSAADEEMNSAARKIQNLYREHRVLQQNGRMKKDCKSVQEKIAEAIDNKQSLDSEPEPSDSSTDEEDHYKGNLTDLVGTTLHDSPGGALHHEPKQLGNDTEVMLDSSTLVEILTESRSKAVEGENPNNEPDERNAVCEEESRDGIVEEICEFEGITAEKEDAPGDGTAEKEDAPDDGTAVKEDAPDDGTAVKEDAPGDGTTEKEDAPGDVTTEKDAPDDETAEKEDAPSDGTAEEDDVPGDETQENEIAAIDGTAETEDAPGDRIAVKEHAPDNVTAENEDAPSDGTADKQDLLGDETGEKDAPGEGAAEKDEPGDLAVENKVALDNTTAKDEGAPSDGPAENEDAATDVTENAEACNEETAENKDGPSDVPAGNEDAPNDVSAENEGASSDVAAETGDTPGDGTVEQDIANSDGTAEKENVPIDETADNVKATSDVSAKNEDAANGISPENADVPSNETAENEDASGAIPAENKDSPHHVSVENDGASSNIAAENEDTPGNGTVVHDGATSDETADNEKAPDDVPTENDDLSVGINVDHEDVSGALNLENSPSSSSIEKVGPTGTENEDTSDVVSLVGEDSSEGNQNPSGDVNTKSENEVQTEQNYVKPCDDGGNKDDVGVEHTVTLVEPISNEDDDAQPNSRPAEVRNEEGAQELIGIEDNSTKELDEDNKPQDVSQKETIDKVEEFISLSPKEPEETLPNETDISKHHVVEESGTEILPVLAGSGEEMTKVEQIGG